MITTLQRVLPKPSGTAPCAQHLGLDRGGQRVQPPHQLRQRRLLGGRQVRRERVAQAVRHGAAVARRLQRRQRRRRALQQRGRAQRGDLPWRKLGFREFYGRNAQLRPKQEWAAGPMHMSAMRWTGKQISMHARPTRIGSWAVAVCLVCGAVDRLVLSDKDLVWLSSRARAVKSQHHVLSRSEV